MPVTTQPIVGVIWNIWVTVSGSSSLSCSVSLTLTILLSPSSTKPNQVGGLTGTLRWVMTTLVSLPRIAMDVIPEQLIALNAYSDVS